MIKTRRSVVQMLLVVLIFTVVIGCSSKSNEPENEVKTGENATTPEEVTKVDDNKPKSIRISYPSLYVPLMMARNKGWMEEEFAKIGVEVEWMTFSTGAAALEALAGGHLDFGGISPIVPITATANGIELKTVATYSVYKKGNAILVHKDSPIHTLEDLKGKKIGVAKGTMSYGLVQTALQKGGLTDKDVELIQLLPDEAKAAFASKAIDAWGVWDPIVTTEIVQNEAVVLTDGEQLNHQTPNYTAVNAKFANEYPDIIELFLKVNIQTAEWMKANEDEAIDLYAEVQKIDRAIAANIAKQNPVIFEPISNEFIEMQKLVSTETLAQGTTKREVDPSEYVDNSYIEAAIKNPLAKR